MKIGNLKVQKYYPKGSKTLWGIFGRPKPGVWLLTNLNNKPLLFDLQYDACCFLETLYEDYKHREASKGHVVKSDAQEKVGA